MHIFRVSLGCRYWARLPEFWGLRILGLRDLVCTEEQGLAPQPRGSRTARPPFACVRTCLGRNLRPANPRFADMHAAVVPRDQQQSPAKLSSHLPSLLCCNSGIASEGGQSRGERRAPTNTHTQTTQHSNQTSQPHAQGPPGSIRSSRHNPTPVGAIETAGHCPASRRQVMDAKSMFTVRRAGLCPSAARAQPAGPTRTPELAFLR